MLAFGNERNKIAPHLCILCRLYCAVTIDQERSDPNRMRFEHEKNWQTRNSHINDVKESRECSANNEKSREYRSKRNYSTISIVSRRLFIVQFGVINECHICKKENDDEMLYAKKKKHLFDSINQTNSNNDKHKAAFLSFTYARCDTKETIKQQI